VAKSKVTAGEVEVDGAATAAVSEPVAKAFRFEVLAGVHYVGDVPYGKDSVVASDDDLVAISGNTKFRRLE